MNPNARLRDQEDRKMAYSGGGWATFAHCGACLLLLVGVVLNIVIVVEVLNVKSAIALATTNAAFAAEAPLVASASASGAFASGANLRNGALLFGQRPKSFDATVGAPAAGAAAAGGAAAAVASKRTAATTGGGNSAEIPVLLEAAPAKVSVAQSLAERARAKRTML
jgi:hypothetical protein